MQLDRKEWTILAVGAAFVALAVYVGYNRTQNKGQPRYESGTGVNVATGLSVVDQLDTGNHYFHPAYCVPGQTQIFTPHRYPSVSGGNISTLIHQGMDALRRQAPQDADWFERPPGDVMW